MKVGLPTALTALACASGVGLGMPGAKPKGRPAGRPFFYRPKLAITW